MIFKLSILWTIYTTTNFAVKIIININWKTKNRKTEDKNGQIKMVSSVAAIMYFLLALFAGHIIFILGNIPSILVYISDASHEENMKPTDTILAIIIAMLITGGLAITNICAFLGLYWNNTRLLVSYFVINIGFVLGIGIMISGVLPWEIFNVVLMLALGTYLWWTRTPKGPRLIDENIIFERE